MEKVPLENIWISAAEAARLLKMSEPSFSRTLARNPPFTTRRIPGLRVRYLRSDVERIAAEAIQPARSA